MIKSRLLKLAAYLEELPPERFGYARWVGESWKGRQDLKCGTTACALGWATRIPEFRRAGLRLARDSWGDGVVCLSADADPNSYDSTRDASRHVFGLRGDEHEYLFLPEDTKEPEHLGCGPEKGCRRTKPCAHATARQVAAHIRRFVEDGGIPEGASP